MRDDLRERLQDRNVRFYEVDSFEETLDGRPVIEQLDALYMTRIQKEHNDPADAASFAAIDFSRYCLTPELVAPDEGVRADPAPVPARSAFRRDSAGDRQRPAGDVLPPGPQRHVDSRRPAWPTSSTWTT